MGRIWLLSGIVIVFLMTLSSANLSVVFAGDKDNNPPGPKGSPGASPDSLKEKIVVDQPWEKLADINKDGVVDQTEFKQWEQNRQNTKKEKAVVNKPWEEKADTNNNNVVDRKEIQQWRQDHPDKDNNPPGPKGGQGTNWENPPGPKGGSGASPNRKR